MNKMVYCVKLQQDAEGLARPPFPGSLGDEIFKNVSKEAWNMWLSHQTMLINEYRLNLIEPQARDFFGDGSEMPQGFNPI